MIRLWAILGAVLLLTAPSGAQEDEPDEPRRPWDEVLDLSGSLRVGAWSATRELDDRGPVATGMGWLSMRPRLGSRATLFAEGWVQHAEVLESEGTSESTAELREAWVDLYLGKLDLRVGKQLLVWGRADGVNPTDNLVPRDYTLLVPKDDQQRLGAPAVRASWFVTDTLSVTGVWIADFEAHEIPVEPLPEPLFVTSVEPDDDHRQWALRVEEIGRTRFDWSISWFDGFDPLPDVAPGLPGPRGVPIVLESHEVEVLGADLATTVGTFGLRGEAAWARAADRNGDDPFVKNSHFFAVLGFDRTLPREVYLNVQGLYRKVEDFRDPFSIADPFLRTVAVEQGAVANQLDPEQYGATLKVSRSFRARTVDAEVSAVYLFTRDDYLVRPRVVWDIDDHLTLTAGADLFGGPDASFFGRLEDNSLVFVELSRGF